MAEPRYDAVADTYAAGADDLSAPATQTLLALAGDVAGQRVLDVACGHGLIAREMARRGATVTGVDLSRALLARARRHERDSPIGIEYVEADIAAAATLAGRAFDVAVSNFGLTDIDDLDGACAAIARLLVPGGRFVASLLHPCFPGVDQVSSSWRTGGQYYDEEWWRADGALSRLRQVVGANHRMVSTYVNTLRRHGLALDEMAEPPPAEEWTAERPGAAAFPVYLVLATRVTSRQ